MSVKLGNAKYGGDFVQKKYFKQKEGEVIFRIIPPLGNLADSGKWSMYYEVHYGYKDSQGKNKPFQSPLVKNRKTKMIEVPDAALEKIEKLKAALVKAKADGDEKTIEGLNKLVGGKGQYNLDKNHYMNVIDQQGNIGVLKIRHNAKKALDIEITRLREKEGVDPLSVDNGRFFIFRRTGMGLDTTFSVAILKEKLNIQGVGQVERDLVHKLDEATIERLGKEAAELDKIFKRPTAEEVAKIVAAGSGSKVIDEILGKANDKAQDDAPPADDEDDTATAAPAATTTQATATVAQTATVQATAPAAAAPAAAPKVEVVTSNKTTAQKLEEVGEAEFLASLNLS